MTKFERMRKGNHNFSAGEYLAILDQCGLAERYHVGIVSGDLGLVPESKQEIAHEQSASGDFGHSEMRQQLELMSLCGMEQKYGAALVAQYGH